MAIYQYNLYLIPQQSIVEKFGKIPSQLFIDHDAWTRHWDKEIWEEGYDFEDALTTNWWKERAFLFERIEPFIHTFAKPVAWSKLSTEHKSFGNNATNDFSIGLLEGRFIDNFHCRIDLRKIDRKFVDHLLSLAKQMDCLLLDRKGNLFKPSFDQLTDKLQQSNAFQFISDPSNFADKFANGKIQSD